MLHISPQLFYFELNKKKRKKLRGMAEGQFQTKKKENEKKYELQKWKKRNNFSF